MIITPVIFIEIEFWIFDVVVLFIFISSIYYIDKNYILIAFCQWRKFFSIMLFVLNCHMLKVAKSTVVMLAPGQDVTI